MVELVADLLERIAARGVSILLVEQKLTIALRISKRAVRDGPRPHRLRRHGRTTCKANEAVRKEWLEV